MLAPEVPRGTPPVSLADFDQGTQCVEGCGDVASLLGHDDQMIVLAIIRERDTEAIEDPAAQRGKESQVHTVLVGKHRIAIRLGDLQFVHAPGDSREKRDLAARDDERAPAEHLPTMYFPLHWLAAINLRRARSAGFGPAEGLRPGKARWSALHGTSCCGNRAAVRQAANEGPTGGTSRHRLGA
jgi:hypothetical protein